MQILGFPFAHTLGRVVILLDKVEQAVVILIVQSQSDGGIVVVQVDGIHDNVARWLIIVVLLPQCRLYQFEPVRVVIERRYIDDR